ncbi:hypothetical protein DPMN_166796 [Dreissena polymorpha]|uniref:Uncharacterized protein n=1 Tax=Dreissena polymorpha TaxID=45954 RepID=A0A9D4EXJ4_DREPO|nr:hypothetical protein DPMN_166796 [Dreissena polymorpha]
MDYGGQVENKRFVVNNLSLLWSLRLSKNYHVISPDVQEHVKAASEEKVNTHLWHPFEEHSKRKSELVCSFTIIVKVTLYTIDVDIRLYCLTNG